MTTEKELKEHDRRSDCLLQFAIVSIASDVNTLIFDDCPEIWFQYHALVFLETPLLVLVPGQFFKKQIDFPFVHDKMEIAYFDSSEEAVEITGKFNVKYGR